MSGMRIMFIILMLSFLVASLWNTLPIIKETVNVVLNPTFGKLLSWNLIAGFAFITFILSLILTFTQKYLTDQESLKKMREEQKLVSEEMKKYKNNPEKLLEFNKKQIESMPKMFELTMKPLVYTSIPIILFFRWFSEILSPIWGN